MIVVNGERTELPGVESYDFTEDSKYRLAMGDGWRKRRTSWVRSIGIHTRLGIPPKLQLGEREGKRGRPGWDEVFAQRMNRDPRYAGAHIAVDGDGSFACVADLMTAAAYHAGQCNEVSIGIEMYQDVDGRVWMATIETTVALIDLITRRFRIQRQLVRERGICRRFAATNPGRTRAAHLAFIPGGLAGKDFVGVWGHRNGTRNRGEGDPGDEIMLALQRAGYEAWWVDSGDDLRAWADRQLELGFREEDCDGVPGPITTAELERAGRKHGLWVERPGD